MASAAFVTQAANHGPPALWFLDRLHFPASFYWCTCYGASVSSCNAAILVIISKPSATASSVRKRPQTKSVHGWYPFILPRAVELWKCSNKPRSTPSGTSFANWAVASHSWSKATHARKTYADLSTETRLARIVLSNIDIENRVHVQGRDERPAGCPGSAALFQSGF